MVPAATPRHLPLARSWQWQSAVGSRRSAVGSRRLAVGSQQGGDLFARRTCSVRIRRNVRQRAGCCGIQKKRKKAAQVRAGGDRCFAKRTRREGFRFSMDSSEKAEESGSSLSPPQLADPRGTAPIGGGQSQAALEDWPGGCLGPIGLNPQLSSKCVQVRHKKNSGASRHELLFIYCLCPTITHGFECGIECGYY